MGNSYSIDGRDTNTANTTILGLTAGATVRPRVHYVVMGSAATPAEMAFEWVMQRTTAAGTSTAVTPQKLDPFIVNAATTAAGEAHSAEPTYTANEIMLAISLNQRATFQWYAQPGREIFAAAVASNGLGGRIITVNGTPVEVSNTWHFEE